MGHFPTGVVIATGCLNGVPAGFAAQSFVSLSLDPPLVALCPGLTSSSWPRASPTLSSSNDAQPQGSRTFQAEKQTDEAGPVRDIAFREGVIIRSSSDRAPGEVINPPII